MKDFRFALLICLLDPADLRLKKKHWREVSTEKQNPSITLYDFECLGFDRKNVSSKS